MEKDLKKFTINKFQKLLNIYVNSFEFEFERQIHLLSLFTEKTIDEVEELELDEFKELSSQINKLQFDSFSTDFKNEIKINDKVFVSDIQDNKYKAKVKEVYLVNKYVNENLDDYLKYIAAIIFKPVVDGNVIKDYSTEGIQERAELFDKEITIDTLSPYLNSLSINLIAKNEVSE
jgi:hypothetical protein